MKKYTIGFFAVFFQLIGLAFWLVSSADYGDAMLVALISELVAVLLYSWLYKTFKTKILKFGMTSSAGLAFVSLASYFEIRGYFG